MILISARFSRVSAALVVGFLLAACTGNGDASNTEVDAERPPPSGELRIASVTSLLDSPYVLGDRLYGFSGSDEPPRLGGSVNSPFVATLAPAAVPDDAGRFVAYHTFKRKSPVLLVRDLETEKDSLLARGAFSVAWGQGGIAYFKGLEPRVRKPLRYLGHVFVKRSLRAPAERWTTTPDRYAVSAWAGKRLIVHRMSRTWPDLLVMEGPRRTRLLAERAALIALSPDGSRAIITEEPSPSPIVSVVNIADGKVLASLDLADVSKEVADEPISYVADSGSWVENTVIAAVSGGLAVFRIDREGIALEQKLSVDAEVFPAGLLEPRMEGSDRTFVTWGELALKPRAALPKRTILECDRFTLRCEQGESIAAPLAPRPVYNPSRP